MENITKHSDTELSISQTVETSQIVSKESLVAQKAFLESRIASTQVELDAVNAKLATAEELGVKTPEELELIEE